MSDPAAWLEWIKVAAVVIGLLIGSAAIGSPSWGASGYGTSASKLKACLESRLKDAATENPAFGKATENLAGENLTPDDLDLIEQLVTKDGSTALVVAWRACKKEARTGTIYFDVPGVSIRRADTLQQMKRDAGDDCRDDEEATDRNTRCACDFWFGATKMPSASFRDWCEALKEAE